MLKQIERLQFARYLVEANDDEFVTFDYEARNDLPVINSIFKKLVNYELYTF